MAIPSSEYWELRALARESRTARRSESLNNQVAAVYDRARRDLQNDMRRILKAYKRSGNLTDQEAEQYLSRLESAQEIQMLKRRIKQIQDPKIRRDLLNRINAPAYRYRLTRAQVLIDNAETVCARISEVQTQLCRDELVRALQDDYMHAMYDAQYGTGIGFSFELLSQDVIEEVIDRKWSGKNFSDRIWDNTHELAKCAKDILQSGIVSGRSPEEMTVDLRIAFQTEKYKAARVIRTELNDTHNQAELLSYRRMGVRKYRYLATLDSRTCAVCGKLDNRLFEVSEAKTAVNYPPMHPNDRCTTVPVFDENAIKDMKRSARDPETGKSVLVPAEMSYAEWKRWQEERHGAGYIDRKQAMRYNESTDRKQFERYQQRLGEDAPRNFKEFQTLKYDHPTTFGDLSGYYKYKGNNPDSNKSFYDANNAAKELRSANKIRAKGIVTVAPKGRSIVDFNAHGVDDMRSRGITQEKAQGFIDNASFALKQRNGTQYVFYTSDGYAVLNNDGLLTSVGYLDEGGRTLYEEVMKYAGNNQ